MRYSADDYTSDDSLDLLSEDLKKAQTASAKLSDEVKKAQADSATPLEDLKRAQATLAASSDDLKLKQWLFEKRLEYARYFFDHHAKQRMSMFNFFLVFVG